MNSSYYEKFIKNLTEYKFEIPKGLCFDDLNHSQGLSRIDRDTICTRKVLVEKYKKKPFVLEFNLGMPNDYLIMSMTMAMWASSMIPRNRLNVVEYTELSADNVSPNL